MRGGKKGGGGGMDGRIDRGQENVDEVMRRREG